MKNQLKWGVVIFASMVLGGAAVVGVNEVGRKDHTVTIFQQGSSSSVSPVADTGSNTVADLYAKVRGSVVLINGSSSKSNDGGLGSGIVLDNKGNILTNNHVVSGFDHLDVQLADGTASSADVVGTDPGSDLAVIKVSMPSDKLKPATLGDSTKSRVGDFVIAVGNPFGIGGTVTEGIISGMGRTLGGGSGRPLRQLIQSDAAINPGNSGGALFDSRGEVIGITTALENPSGENLFVGIGYAIPSDTVKRFLPEILSGKTVEHPRLGVGLQNVTPSLAKTLSISVDQGVLVTQVDPSSAAGKAGVKGGTGGKNGLGDVVTAIDGKEVKTYDDLANYIDSKKVGDKITLKLLRNGKDATSVDVTLDAWKTGNQS